MKDLPSADRPREKLLRHGAAALGDNELVALVIGSGTRDEGALDVANAALAAHGGLRGLGRAHCDDLTSVRGVGPARAARLVAALELGRRALTERADDRWRVSHPHAAAQYLLPRYGAAAVEQLGIMLLDTRHRVFRTCVLAVGTLNTTAIEPRDVFREAARAGAAAIVVFHNHPSGDPEPSADDVELTRRLAAAGVLMGIDVLDHIVLGDGRYYSFKETRNL
jgi:DNA repair protein RadC